jgi:putative ABC transport system permease protein
MKNSIDIIPYANLAMAFIPVMVVIVILWRWKVNYSKSIYAVGRMLIQLMLIGYFLVYIFESDSSWVVIMVLTIMLLAASWISMRTMKLSRKTLYPICFMAVMIGGVPILILITQVVLDLPLWYQPSYVVPLAGMIFANAMNSISLAGERFEAEMERKLTTDQARIIALKASLIPITNSLLAVGLVSLPGMMTGQILSGVSPLIAARYQVVVMCMMFGSAGISAALFLHLIKSAYRLK